MPARRCDYHFALRVKPDQLALIECDGATVTELDMAAVVSAQDVWYHVSAAFEGGTVTVTRTSPTAGGIMTLTGVSSVLSGLSGVADTVGFTVGNQGEYHFHNLQYATTPGATAVHVEWAYDALGRQIAKTVYDGTGTVTGQSRYLYDGWQLVQEVAPNTGVITTTYVHGPGYIDDIVAQVRNGQTYYHHADQQYSTMAVTDATGAPVERYTYDPFGSPTIRNGAGTPITATTINNDILYTGRPWDPQLNLYDYRTRHYNPMLGRFTTPDPANDPANLGNPFTYTANNPLTGTDPYGMWAWDADFVEYGLGGLMGFHGTAVAGETWRGAGAGALNGAVVTGDYASFGRTRLHESAVAIQTEASESGDVMSQIGFGLGKVGVDAAYAAAGGAVVGAVASSATGAAIIANHSTAAAVVMGASAVGAAVGAGYSAGSALSAGAAGDWAGAVHAAGDAGIGAGFACAAAKLPTPSTHRVGAFSRVTTPWNRRVWQRADIDWSLIRPEGTSNLEAARQGYSPMRHIGDTFENVELHHIGQDPAGSLAEVFASTHRQIPHTVPPPSWRVTQPESASAFRREVPSYWRWRASQIGED